MSSPIKVTILDFGLAVEDGIDDTATGLRGTIPFLPLEVLLGQDANKPSAPSLDVFAMARILVQIWGGFDYSYDFQATREHIFAYRDYLRSTEFSELKKLFVDILPKDRDLLATRKLDKDIKSCLQKMLDNAPPNRITIYDAIPEFDRIIDRFNQKIPAAANLSGRVEYPSAPLTRQSSSVWGSVRDKLSVLPCFLEEDEDETALVEAAASIIVSAPKSPYAFFAGGRPVARSPFLSLAELPEEEGTTSSVKLTPFVETPRSGALSRVDEVDELPDFVKDQKDGAVSGGLRL